MLIYIIIITLVIVLCLYKMSTKNVNDMEDDDGLAFFYMKSNSGSSGSGGGKDKNKNVPSGNAAINVASDKNVQKLKDAAKNAYAKANAAQKKWAMATNNAIGTNNQDLSKKELAKLQTLGDKWNTFEDKAAAAQRKYEAALGKVPTVGQFNSDGTAVWTSRGGWTNINTSGTTTGQYGANANPGDMNVYSMVNGGPGGVPAKAAFFDGLNWNTMNAA